MNDKPAISIIVPSYNEEKNIAACIECILEQTFKDFEIICVDDNSTDSTFSIISSYAEKFSNIRAFKNPGKGVSSARNYGIDKADGEYIGFVDSDDFIQPQMYEFLYRAVTENNSDFSVCNYEKSDTYIKKYFKYTCENFKCDDFIKFNDYDFMYIYNTVIVSALSKIIKKEYLYKCGNFKNYKIGEDMLFCSNLWSNSKKYIFVNLPLYIYINNNCSVTHSESSNIKWFDFIKSIFLSYENFLKGNNKKTAAYNLERGMKFILSYRYNILKQNTNFKLVKELRKYFYKYFKKFIFNSYIPIKNKIAITAFYFLPFLYEAYRKKLDKTL